MPNTTEKSAEQSSDIAADIATLRADLAKFGASVAEFVQQQTAQTEDKVRGAIDHAREHLARSASDAKQSVRSTSADFEGSIERSPLTAVMIALMCGLLLGMMGRGPR